MAKEVHRGEVYYCELEGKGSVQNGIRPCVIVSNELNNKHANIVMVVPVTTAQKHKLPTHVPVWIKKCSTVLCEQVITIEKKRLLSKICDIKDMRGIDKAIGIAIGTIPVK